MKQEITTNRFCLDSDLRSEYKTLIKELSVDINTAIKVARFNALSVLIALDKTQGDMEAMLNDAYSFLRTFGGC